MIFLKQLAQIANIKHSNPRLVNFMEILHLKLCTLYIKYICINIIYKI